jgi:4'-phosphopantetheinyl transferase
VIAISAQTPLGVDVERFDELLDHEALIVGASSAERSAFSVLSPEKRAIGFFHWWTRKEAVMKALGAGLSLPLDSFDVSITPGDARLTAARLPELTGPWWLRDIEPDDGYVGAVASPGPPKKIENLWFDPTPSGEQIWRMFSLRNSFNPQIRSGPPVSRSLL